VPPVKKIAYAGIVHNPICPHSGEPPMNANLCNFPVENRLGTPYGTRSYLPDGAALKTGLREAGLSPRALAERRKNMLSV